MNINPCIGGKLMPICFTLLHYITTYFHHFSQFSLTVLSIKTFYVLVKTFYISFFFVHAFFNFRFSRRCHKPIT